jgi:hypothetical protein
MAQLEITLPVEKLKTQTKYEEVKDKDGHILDRRIITTVTFETEGVPRWLPQALHFQMNGIPINATLTSEQSFMDDISTVEVTSGDQSVKVTGEQFSRAARGELPK